MWPQCGPGRCGKGSNTAGPADGRERGDHKGSRAWSSKEVQIPGTVRRAWWLHWGRPTEVWRKRGGDAGTGLLVHRVGHSHRRALRGRKGVGRECRPHAFCTPMQIDDKGPSCRQAWQGPSHSQRQAARRMGTSKGYRRKPHSGTTYNPHGLRIEARRNVLSGEPVGFILVAAPSDGAIHKEVPEDLPRSVLLWIRIQETHSYTNSCGLDDASLWHLPGGRRASTPTRGFVREDAGFLPRPTGGGMEDSVGRRIPSPPVLVVGWGSQEACGDARGQGEPLEADYEEGRRQQVGQERSTGSRGAPEVGEKGESWKTRRHWGDFETPIRQSGDCQRWRS